jgi:spermidine/putrescine transport system permease protein
MASNSRKGSPLEIIKTVLVLPGTAWLFTFVAAPLLGVLALSVMQRGNYGEIIPAFTTENYSRLIGFGSFGFDPIYLRILLHTLTLSVSSTLLCVVMGLPLTFWIASLKQPLRTIMLVVVIIPFWTNLLVRTYAWQIILGPTSPLSSLGQSVGALEPGTGFYPGSVAMLMGLLCDYLPYFVLPVFTSVERIDWRIWEAARDLGAGSASAFRHAVLPQITPGILAGVTLVFIPSLGQFVVPDLLGGARTMLIGNSIAQQFGAARDWPFGAAIASAQIVFALLVMTWLKRKQAMEGL